MPFQMLPEIVRCPITKEPLQLMSDGELDYLNSQILTGRLLHTDGTLITGRLEAGLRSVSGHYAYRIESNIGVLLPHLAIVLTRDRSRVINFDEEKIKVQRFYDELGWQRNEDGSSYIDQVVFEDHRPVSQEYRLRCDLRVKRYLKPHGKFLLDVASGPIPRPEYLLYSEGYDFRICADFSYQALIEAKRKLGDRALYILGDITNLPLQDKCMDGVISLHTIYHVPADQQRIAFSEIYRVLKPGSSAIVVYSWGGRSFIERYPIRIMNAIIHPLALMVHATKAFVTGDQKAKRTLDQPLYAHMHSYRWFKQLSSIIDFDLASWRSVTVPFMRRYIRHSLFGGRLLALIYWLEDTFPYVLGRLGAYPMFIIRK